VSSSTWSCSRPAVAPGSCSSQALHQLEADDLFIEGLHGVEVVVAARNELEAAGVEVSELHEGESWLWASFRAPDSNLYEIAKRA
jgi:hypothetical protein